MANTDAEVASRVADVLASFANVEAPLLEILHAVQHELGYVPDAAKLQIAEALNLSRAEVHGVVSFYHDFRDAPAGRHVLKICRAEACQSMGAEANARRAQEVLGIGMGATMPNGAATLEAVYCLGMCACAPAVMIDDRPVGRVDGEMLETLLVEAQR
ncbi:MAG: formate dehydrogenase subunit gamma [Hyphomicrobiaceae bacterium]